MSGHPCLHSPSSYFIQFLLFVLFAMTLPTPFQAVRCLYIPQCLSVSQSVRCADQKKKKSGGQFSCVAVQLVQATCVCCTCVRTAFQRLVVIFYATCLYIAIVGVFCCHCFCWDVCYHSTMVLVFQCLNFFIVFLTPNMLQKIHREKRSSQQGSCAAICPVTSVTSVNSLTSVTSV